MHNPLVYEDFVKPVCEMKCGLTCERGDDAFGSNVVMDDVLPKMADADVVIAELTGKNPTMRDETSRLPLIGVLLTLSAFALSANAIPPLITTIADALHARYQAFGYVISLQYLPPTQPPDEQAAPFSFRDPMFVLLATSMFLYVAIGLLSFDWTTGTASGIVVAAGLLCGPVWPVIVTASRHVRGSSRFTSTCSRLALGQYPIPPRIGPRQASGFRARSWLESKSAGPAQSVSPATRSLWFFAR